MECELCLSEGVHEAAVRECDQCGFRVGACSADNWKCPRHFDPGGSCDGKLVAHRAAVVADSPELAQARAALSTINGIRNSIIGSQSINWSEHIYPLVAALNAAGFPGENYPVARENFGTLAERAFAAEAELAQARERIAALEAERDEYVAEVGLERDAALARVAELEAALSPDWDLTVEAARADERARTERDIAAHCRAGAKRNEAAADRGRHGDPFFAAVLNGSVNGMNSIAEDIERGDYAREGT